MKHFIDEDDTQTCLEKVTSLQAALSQSQAREAALAEALDQARADCARKDEALRADKDLEDFDCGHESEERCDCGTIHGKMIARAIELRDKALTPDPQFLSRVRMEARREAFEEVGMRYSKLLQISIPADHIRTDNARERELAIYRSESKYWHGQARAQAAKGE